MITNETIEHILSRRTIREYTDEQLTGEELDMLLNCALWAPSARNMQPCHLRVVQDKKLLDEMNEDFKDKVGRDTPAYTNWNKNPFYQNAPTVFFMFSEGDCAMDGGIMAENIVIAAKSMGISTCIIGSIGALLNDDEGIKWKKKLDIPEHFRFLIAIAAGHGAENPAPKARKPEQFKIIKTEK